MLCGESRVELLRMSVKDVCQGCSKELLKPAPGGWWQSRGEVVCGYVYQSRRGQQCKGRRVGVD
jgi:hypothetical protein